VQGVLDGNRNFASCDHETVFANPACREVCAPEAHLALTRTVAAGTCAAPFVPLCEAPFAVDDAERDRYGCVEDAASCVAECRAPCEVPDVTCTTSCDACRAQCATSADATACLYTCADARVRCAEDTRAELKACHAGCHAQIEKCRVTMPRAVGRECGVARCDTYERCTRTKPAEACAPRAWSPFCAHRCGTRR
jgi:hypothetical protein